MRSQRRVPPCGLSPSRWQRRPSRQDHSAPPSLSANGCPHPVLAVFPAVAASSVVTFGQEVGQWAHLSETCPHGEELLGEHQQDGRVRVTPIWPADGEQPWSASPAARQGNLVAAQVIARRLGVTMVGSGLLVTGLAAPASAHPRSWFANCTAVHKHGRTASARIMPTTTPRAPPSRTSSTPPASIDTPCRSTAGLTPTRTASPARRRKHMGLLKSLGLMPSQRAAAEPRSTFTRTCMTATISVWR